MRRRTILRALAQKGLLLAIHFYKNTFSILFGPCCRFVPSCSSYCYLSIQRFGIIRGVWFSLKRISKCHPFHTGGCDPVPEIRK